MNNILHINSANDKNMYLYRITILKYFFLQVMYNRQEKKEVLEFTVGVGILEFAWSLGFRK
jgi:hypothetical protein